MSPSESLKHLNYFQRELSCAGRLYPYILLSPWVSTQADGHKLFEHLCEISKERGFEPIKISVTDGSLQFNSRTLKSSLWLRRFARELRKDSGLILDFFNRNRDHSPLFVYFDLSVLNFSSDAELDDFKLFLRNSRRFGFFFLFHGYSSNRFIHEVEPFTVNDY